MKREILKQETVELWMFSSPHLKVEAGANDVAKLSKPKRENFKINNFKPGSSVYINTLHT